MNFTTFLVLIWFNTSNYIKLTIILMIRVLREGERLMRALDFVYMCGGGAIVCASGGSVWYLRGVVAL